MITVERLDKIEQDLKWARDNADRSAQTRLFGHHVPFLLTILRPVAEEMDAMRAEEEEWKETSDALEVEADLDKADPVVGEVDETPSGPEATETIGVGAKIKEFLSPSDDADADPTYAKVPESEEATEDDPFIESDGSPEATE